MDKSSKFAIASLESYDRQGDQHCRGDPIVTWDTITQSKMVIICHCKALPDLTLWGSHGQNSMERAWEAKELDFSTIPLVKFTAKDHKSPETNGDPKTRPTCCCDRSINGELSE